MQEWHLTNEYSARMGCGMLTAVILPLWFLALYVAFADRLTDLAIGLFSVTMIVIMAVAVGAVSRLRSIPRVVRLTDDHLELQMSARTRVVALDDITAVRVGPEGRLKPVVVEVDQGRSVRLSRDLDDFEGFLAALGEARPDLAIDRSQ